MEKIRTDSWIREYLVELTPPSLKDNTGDVDRLIKSLKRENSLRNISMPLDIIREDFPSLIRSNNFRLRVVGFEDKGIFHIINVSGMEISSPYVGVAIDLGTSTVVMRFVNINTGETLKEVSFLNPQNEIGPDILTRIHFRAKEEGRKRLRELVLVGINGRIGEFSKEMNIDSDHLIGACISGNTTMIHLLLGLNPYYICREPYIPVINVCELFCAGDTGLGINPRAPVMIMPSVGSYLGGDLISGILSVGIADKEDISLLVDVGTNAEVVVGNKEWIIGCAGAAGPALEGGVASSGMMAGGGVIDRVRVEPDTGRITFHTIGDKRPVGICGSGLIDLIAGLFRAGMIDFRGRFVPSRCGDRVKEIDGVNHFVLVEAHNSAQGMDITINQAEIDSIIRSKAAMFTILQTIIEMINIEFKDIKNIYLGGTFGSFINPVSAITIGMIPDLPLSVYKPVGNTSLSGACMALLSTQAREKTYAIRDMITYVELSVNQRFMELFTSYTRVGRP